MKSMKITIGLALVSLAVVLVAKENVWQNNGTLQPSLNLPTTTTFNSTAMGAAATASLSTDTTFASPSSTAVPTTTAVKTYADTKATASTASKIYSGAAVAMPLTNTVKKGDVYISDEGDAYLCCATGADTTGWKKAN
jgi:hypothetical protein